MHQSMVGCFSRCSMPSLITWLALPYTSRCSHAALCHGCCDPVLDRVWCMVRISRQINPSVCVLLTCSILVASVRSLWWGILKGLVSQLFCVLRQNNLASYSSPPRKEHDRPKHGIFCSISLRLEHASSSSTDTIMALRVTEISDDLSGLEIMSA